MDMIIEKSTTQKARNTSTLNRVFTEDFSKSVWDSTELVKASSKITDADGKPVFEVKDIEVPKNWSQLAIDILASKYFKRAGVPETGHEISIKQVIARIVKTLSKTAEDYSYFSKEDAKIFEDELSYLLIHQIGAFNSPVWFNLGLWHAYDISGSGGNFAWNFDLEQPVQTNDSYSRPQCSACFIQSVEDDLMSIFELSKNEAKLFKFGSGSGTNFSKIRGKNEALSGGGTSSGLMSFLDVLDKGAGATKSGGITRRAAKMVCLDSDHPEIFDFIHWKLGEEKKATALLSAGFSAGFEGEAYKSVSGQNSNNSIRVSDEFMKKFEKNETWSTVNRTTQKTHESFPASQLWEKIAEAAWSCADPGLQFDTTINDWHTCPESGRINASNPCSEFMFIDDTACNLASLNLLKFLNTDGSFDTKKFSHACKVFLIAQDILVDLSSYPTEKITENSHKFRPLGLGYANLGTLLMMKGIAYDSEEGRSVAAGITALMTATAYECSAEMASKKGAFKEFSKNKNSMLKVIQKHQSHAQKISEQCPGDIKKAALESWSRAYELGKKFGYRNSQVSVLAPTGTIGLLMDCDTTGVEPEFALVKYKKLSGGGYIKIPNRSVTQALRNLKYTENEIQIITDYLLENQNLENAPHLINEHLPIFDCANKCGADGKRFIDPMGHIKMMAAVQPFLSGAISKTVNLPNNVSIKQVENIFYEAWKQGLKAVTIYRDGSKHGQPLNTEDKKEAKKDEKEEKPFRVKRRKLPPKRTGFTQEASVGGHKIHLRTGDYEDGTLGEIFIDMHKEGAAYRSMMSCFAISVSLGLQYGVPLEEFINKFTFTRFEPSGPVSGHPNIKLSTSVVDYVFRVLGLEYLKRTDFLHVKPVETTNLSPMKIEASADEVKGNANKYLEDCMGDAPPCDQCGHTTVRNGSCYRCLNCGNSLGCS